MTVILSSGGSVDLVALLLGRGWHVMRSGMWIRRRGSGSVTAQSPEEAWAKDEETGDFREVGEDRLRR